MFVHILAVVCLILAGSAADATQVDGPERRGVGALDQLFLDARRAEYSNLQLSNRLHARGVATAAELFDFLSSGVLQIRVGDRGRSSEPLTEAERHALTSALDRLPLKPVRELLVKRLDAGPSQSTRLAAIALVASIGEPSDVHSLLNWAQVEGVEVRIPRAIRAALGQGLRTILEREPTALRHFPGLYGSANPSLLPAFLTALGSKKSPERLDTLGTLLGVEPRCDAHVLAEIDEMVRGARFVMSDATRARVRYYISSDEIALSGVAISIAKTAADPEAIAPLLNHLAGGNADLRRRALLALSDISGEQLEPTFEAWQMWHERTSAWWRGERARFLELARNGKPGAASRALGELSMLRTHRHELVPGLTAVLNRSEVELVVLATACLGHLGSMAAIPHLVSQLEEKNPDVRRAAYHALRRMTGENFSDDPVAWRAAGWGASTPH